MSRLLLRERVEQHEIEAAKEDVALPAYYWNRRTHWTPEQSAAAADEYMQLSRAERE